MAEAFATNLKKPFRLPGEPDDTAPAAPVAAPADPTGR